MKNKVIINGIEYVPVDTKVTVSEIELMRAMMSNWATKEMLDTDEKVIKEAKYLRVLVSDDFSVMDNDEQTVYKVVISCLNV